MLILFLVVALSVGVGIWIFASAYLIRGLEEPRYEVVLRHDRFEVRDYAPTVVAEIDIPGDPIEASDEGFSILSAYVFGTGDDASDVGMPRSAADVDASVPVHPVAFVLPAGAEPDGPKDTRIRIREVPGRRVAALRFRWPAGPARIGLVTREFHSLIRRSGLEPVGEAELARYNPPFTFPALVVSEILIEVRS